MSEQLITLCDNNNTEYKAFISTNGSLINSDVADRMLSCRIKKIQVSIDGPRKWHNKQRLTTSKEDSYNSVLRGISNLVETYNSKERFITVRVQL